MKRKCSTSQRATAADLGVSRLGATHPAPVTSRARPDPDVRRRARPDADVQPGGAVPGPVPPGHPVRIGVGIDTSRYGHYAAFLRGDLQPADEELKFAESADGYAKFAERIERIRHKYGPIDLAIRIDAAGPYAQNLEAFLRSLPGEKAISLGDPVRNKNYRVAVFGMKKADPIEARAAARFAIAERPEPAAEVPAELRTLREIAGRLEAHGRSVTRLVNQLHNLLARVFPELACVVSDLRAVWVLELLARYPTPARIAAAQRRGLEAVRYLPHDAIEPLVHWARRSVASLKGPHAETLVAMLVEQLRVACAIKKRLENMLVAAYRALPLDNQIHTITGIGDVTAAVLTAKIVSIDRFATPAKLVSYFGIYPIEFASGVGRDGELREPTRLVMSQRGNDLVRRYLWMAALTAIEKNPAVRALYQRRSATLQEGEKGIALGHAMRKLLHQVWGVCTSGRPYDPEHETPPSHCAADLCDAPHETRASHCAADLCDAPHETRASHSAAQPRGGSATSPVAEPIAETSEAADRNRELCPETQAVTAASPPSVASSSGHDQREHRLAMATPKTRCASDATGHPRGAASPPRPSPWIDFVHLRSQLPLERVLRDSGHLDSLKGRGPQRRGPCPLHAAAAHDRSFSVHLGENRFYCFDLACGARGDVIDFWAALERISLREAALDLVERFSLEPSPAWAKSGNREEATV